MELKIDNKDIKEKIQIINRNLQTVIMILFAVCIAYLYTQQRINDKELIQYMKEDRSSAIKAIDNNSFIIQENTHALRSIQLEIERRSNHVNKNIEHESDDSIK